MTSVEFLMQEIMGKDFRLTISDNDLNRYQEAVEMHKAEQENLYTEEQVREALFFALNVNRTTCCTTRTTDSIVRESIQLLNGSKESNTTSDFDKPFMDFAKQYFKPKK